LWEEQFRKFWSEETSSYKVVYVNIGNVFFKIIQLIFFLLKILFFSDSRYMIPDVASFLLNKRGNMFSSTDSFVIHGLDIACKEDSSLTENSNSSLNIEEYLKGFKWEKKGLRLYKLITDQVDKNDFEELNDYFIIDLIKYVVTPENKFNASSDSTIEKKILSFLKRLKRVGCKIPQTFIVRKKVKSIF